MTSIESLVVAGSVVHYVLPCGPQVGEHRAAVVVGVGEDEEGQFVDLHVHTRYSSDVVTQYGPVGPIAPAFHARYSEANELGSWHWVEWPGGEGGEVAEETVEHEVASCGLWQRMVRYWRALLGSQRVRGRNSRPRG